MRGHGMDPVAAATLRQAARGALAELRELSMHPLVSTLAAAVDDDPARLAAVAAAVVTEFDVGEPEVALVRLEAALPT